MKSFKNITYQNFRFLQLKNLFQRTYVKYIFFLEKDFFYRGKDWLFNKINKKK